MLGLSTVLAVFGLWLLAWAMEGRTRRPLLALPALFLVVVAIGARLLAGGGLILTIGGLFLDLGLGLLAAGGYARLRHAEARRFLLPAALSLFLAGVSTVPAVTIGVFGNRGASASLERTAGHFLLELGPDDDISELASILDHYGAGAERAFPNLTLDDDEDLAQYYIVSAQQRSLQALMNALAMDTENVDNTEWDIEVEAVPTIEVKTGLPEVELTRNRANDPRLNQQWGFLKTNGNAVHDLLQSRNPQQPSVVAIVDTGVDSDHEDIRDSFDDSPGTGDGNGHGTHCAGVAGAATNNGIGIASYNWDSRFVRIRSYRALGDNGGGSAETVAQAIIDATRDGADVISLSLGSWSPVPPKVEIDAIEFALRNDVIVVAAAGNASSNAKDHSPANIEGVISVAAVDQSNGRASFSNRNTGLKRPIAAPGVEILSLKPGNQYVALNGTSMATPHVAGLLGVMRALRPQISADEAYEILRRTGDDGPDASSIGNTIDAAAAIDATISSAFKDIRIGS